MVQMKKPKTENSQYYFNDISVNNIYCWLLSNYDRINIISIVFFLFISIYCSTTVQMITITIKIATNTQDEQYGTYTAVFRCKIRSVIYDRIFIEIRTVYNRYTVSIRQKYGENTVVNHRPGLQRNTAVYG